MASSCGVSGYLSRRTWTAVHTDHDTCTFSPEQVRAARHAQDLVATLPGMTIDPMSEQLKSLSGKAVKVLINGIEATTNDLKSLEGGKVRSVDYYVMPSARFHNVGTLINIHTRSMENGYALGADEMQSINSGFCNTCAYARYNTGHSQLSLSTTVSNIAITAIAIRPISTVLQTRLTMRNTATTANITSALQIRISA